MTAIGNDEGQNFNISNSLATTANRQWLTSQPTPENIPILAKIRVAFDNQETLTSI